MAWKCFFVTRPLSLGDASLCLFLVKCSHWSDIAFCGGVKRLRSRLVYRSRRVECNSSKVFVYDNSLHKACGTLFSFLRRLLASFKKRFCGKKFACGVPWVTLGFTCEWKSWLWIHFAPQLSSRNDKNFYWVEFSEWMTRGLRMPATSFARKVHANNRKALYS